MENVEAPKKCYWELVPDTTSTTLRLMKRHLLRKNEVLAHVWLDSTNPIHIEEVAKSVLGMLKEMGEI